MFGKTQSDKNVQYVYVVINDEVVKTYELQQKDDQYYLVYINQIYVCVRGEKTFEILRGKGYISLQEACLFYGVSEIPVLEQPKKEGFMKTLLQKKGKH